MGITSWGEAMTQGIIDSWVTIIGFLPNLVGAIIVLLVGLIVAWVLEWIVIKFFDFVKLQALADQIKLTALLQKMKVTKSVSEILGIFIYWIVVVIFLLPTFQILGLSQVNDILASMLSYVPNVLIAAFIVLIGVLLADVVTNLVKGAAVGLGSTVSGIIASVCHYAILIFVIIAALSQLGIATYLLNTLFTGFIAMIAIAGGLAFGLGGKDAAKDLIEKIKKDFSVRD